MRLRFMGGGQVVERGPQPERPRASGGAPHLADQDRLAGCRRQRAHRLRRFRQLELLAPREHRGDVVGPDAGAELAEDAQRQAMKDTGLEAVQRDPWRSPRAGRRGLLDDHRLVGRTGKNVERQLLREAPAGGRALELQQGAGSARRLLRALPDRRSTPAAGAWRRPLRDRGRRAVAADAPTRPLRREGSPGTTPCSTSVWSSTTTGRPPGMGDGRSDHDHVEAPPAVGRGPASSASRGSQKNSRSSLLEVRGRGTRSTSAAAPATSVRMPTSSSRCDIRRAPVASSGRDSSCSRSSLPRRPLDSRIPTRVTGRCSRCRGRGLRAGGAACRAARARGRSPRTATSADTRNAGGCKAASRTTTAIGSTTR